MPKNNMENFEYYNILITPSSELFKQALVVMMSAILNSEKTCKFYIMQSDWTDKQKEECKIFIGNHFPNTVEFININDEVFTGLLPWKGRYGSYYKLLCHLYLPESVEKILYLDCDVMILKDINSFYSTDIEGLLGAFSSNYTTLSSQIISMQRLTGTINTGCLLLNLYELRKCNIDIELYKKAATNIGSSYLADQGLFNYILFEYFESKMKVYPSYLYNYIVSFAGNKELKGDNYEYFFSLSPQDREKIQSPYFDGLNYNDEHAMTIAHFCGPGVPKPWAFYIEKDEDIDCLCPMDSKFLKNERIKKLYSEWWNIASQIPDKYYYQLLLRAKNIKHEAYYRVIKTRSVYANNALNFIRELCLDMYGYQRFDRFVKGLSGKTIALLKQQDSSGVCFKKALEKANIKISFLTDKANLSQLAPEEFADCKKADVIITCCIHGTKTHERDGVKCIDIWDILRDDSLTANLPEIPDGTDNIKIDGSISELHEDILKLSEHINEEFVKLPKASDETLNEEIKTLHSEKDKLNEELSRLSSENKSLTERIAQITEEKSTLLENILSVSREKDALNSELFELNSKLNAEQNAASAAIRKADSLSADISLLKEKIAQLEKEKSIADSELDKTKQELKNEQEVSAASAQKAELLNNKILEMQSTRSWRYTRIFRKNKKDEEI